MFKYTKEQLLALKKLFDHFKNRGMYGTYLQFRRKVFLAYGDIMMVPLEHITIEIEPDGHTYS